MMGISTTHSPSLAHVCGDPVDDWRDEALCSLPIALEHVDFFSETPDEIDKSLRICHECPVRDTCLETAMSGAEVWGVWGGTTADERREALNMRADGRVGTGNVLLKCLKCGSSDVTITHTDRLWVSLECTCGMEWRSRNSAYFILTQDTSILESIE